MNVFTIFRKRASAAVAPAEVEETVQQGFRRREGELLDQLHDIDARLDVLHSAMAKFRAEHTCSIDGQVILRGEAPDCGPSLQHEWATHTYNLGVLLEKRSTILREWSSLKVVSCV